MALNWEALAIQGSHVEEIREMIRISKDRVVVLQGTSLSLPQVVAVARGSSGVEVELDSESAKSLVEGCTLCLQESLKDGKDIYGVTTGFGAHSSRRTTRHVELQQELIRYLQAGVITNEGLSTAVVRAAMLVRVNCLLQGYSGVRWQILETLVKFINLGISPRVPLRGSITASGDLMPLAYIVGVLIGRPNARASTNDGSEVNSAQALAMAQIQEPFKLQPKEGLGLVNGTPVASGLASMVCFDAHILVLLAEVLTAMFCEVLYGRIGFVDPLIHKLKHHPGQIEAAAVISYLLEGSSFMEVAGGLNEIDFQKKAKQDSYSLRTSPQWIGPQTEVIRGASRAVEKEINSVSDNPLIDTTRGKTLHGGNFQGTSVGVAMDNVRLAVCAIGKLVFAQFSELVNAAYNNGLPTNLSSGVDPCLDYGFDCAEIAMAAYISELSYLANPVTTHVHVAEHHNQSVNSLALISARKSEEAIDVLKLMLSTYLVVVCQAIDLRHLEDVMQKVVINEVTSAADHYLPSCKQSLIEAAEKLPIFTYLHSPCDPQSSLMQSLRNMFFAGRKKNGSLDPKPGLDQFEGFEDELISQLKPKLEEARMSFEHGKMEVENKIKSCRSFPLYKFVRHDLQTAILVGGKELANSVTPGEDFTKVYASICDGSLVAPLLGCLEGFNF